MKRNKYLYITLLSLLGFQPETYAQAVLQIPRLVVSMTVDDLDRDMLEQYVTTQQAPRLQQMMEQGTVYPHVVCGFSPANKVAMLASLYTGAMPYYHGITDSEWLNRSTLRPQRILQDDRYQVSPQQIAVSTLSDELKIATKGAAKVFSLGYAAESVILAAGHAADAAGWCEQGPWQTTDYYSPENAWLKALTKKKNPQGDANQQVVTTALECIREHAIGQDDIPDLLCLSLTANSSTALDASITMLMDSLASEVLPERTLFVLVGSGSRKEDEEQLNSQYRVPTGQFYIHRSANLLNVYLGAVYGAGKYVETTFGNQFFLNKKLISKKNINMSDLLKRSQEFLLQLAGVKNVYTVHQLLTTTDAHLQAVRNGFYAEKCGDLLVEIAPGWQLVNENTHTSTLSRFGQVSFPVIFYGGSIKPQQVVTPITIDRIAPTIARAIRIRAPNACLAEPLF